MRHFFVTVAHRRNGFVRLAAGQTEAEQGDGQTGNKLDWQFHGQSFNADTVPHNPKMWRYATRVCQPAA